MHPYLWSTFWTDSCDELPPSLKKMTSTYSCSADAIGWQLGAQSISRTPHISPLLLITCPIVYLCISIPICLFYIWYHLIFKMGEIMKFLTFYLFNPLVQPIFHRFSRPHRGLWLATLGAHRRPDPCCLGLLRHVEGSWGDWTPDHGDMLTREIGHFFIIPNRLLELDHNHNIPNHNHNHNPKS